MAQAQIINQHLKAWGAVGFRAGFMFHNLEWLHSLDVSYDASTSSTRIHLNHSRMASALIFPFWVQGSGSRGYVEFPYTLPQDSTLFLVFKEKTIDVWTKKLEWVAAHGGMALMNVHPDYLNFGGAGVRRSSQRNSMNPFSSMSPVGIVTLAGLPFP